MLKLLESYFLDKSLNTSVLRCDMLSHSGIVRKFHIAKVAEVHNNNDCSDGNQTDNKSVVSVFLDIFYL